jgi:methanogenic corrinoid protein MtbC1
MEPHLIIIEEIMVVGMDVVGIKGDVLKIFQERILHATTESGITMKQNNMEIEKVYRINPQKPMKKNVIGVV